FANGNPSVHFKKPTFAGAEGTTPAVVTVVRTGSATATASVDFAVADGSATNPGDYKAKTGTLNFAAGVTSKTFGVTIKDDVAAEGTESVALTLSNAAGVTLGEPSTAVINISDNDGSVFFLPKTSYIVNEGNSQKIMVNRSGSLAASATVR